MTNQVAIDTRAFSPKFDIEKRLAASTVQLSGVRIAADVSSDQFPTKTWHPDSRIQLSMTQWLNKYGLKANNLDSQTLFPKLGFPRVESFNKVLHKPVHSKYGESLFPKHFREDGLTFNIVAKKDRLLQAQTQLENVISLYQQRLDWLSSESRRIFGVIEEHCVTIIIDIKTTSKTDFDQFICALERLIEEQLRYLVKFNLIRVQESMAQLFPAPMQVTKETLASATDWIWNLKRTEPTSAANIVEAMIRASRDKENEAIYLITVGTSSDGSREVLREKIKQLRVPFNIITYNCNNSDLLEYLYCLTTLTGGRFHTYSFNMEIDAYERSPLDEINPVANITVKKRVYGGTVGGIGKRKDCVDLFSEMEEAKLILSQIKSLINQIPDKKVIYDDEVVGSSREGHIPKEEYMSSREWLARFGLKPRKLDFFDVLGGVCFRHCDGVVEVLEPPSADKVDLMEQQDATIHQKLVNAKYCDKFAHVRWKDGSLVHVQMSSDVHRLYNERMNICLSAIRRRIEWLRQGSRELFGTIMEDQVYILIDTSASMEPHIAFVKDKLYTLIQEQLRHKSKINFVAFNSKALPWRDRLVDVTESSLTSAWHWIEGLSCQGSTNTLAALQFAIKDRNCLGIYLLTDGRPDQPPKMVLSQIKLQHRLPIHTISFNCADLDANKFLCELARETGGRFHYFNEVTGGADCADDEDLEAWESEDIQVLKAEYRLGSESLEKVTKLRDECHRLAWKKEIELKTESKTARRIMPPGCSDGLTRGRVSPTRLSSGIQNSKSPKRVKSRNTYKKQKNDPVWPGTIQLLEFQSPRYSGNAGSYFSFLQALNAHSTDEQDWMLQETKDVLDRQKERFVNTIEEELKENADKDKPISKEKKTKPKELTMKQWLNIYGLVPQHMSILDALAPTIVKVRPKYVPIIDKHVMSKVFDEIFPIAHVVTEGSPRKGYKPVVRLVNPLAVDLKGYQNNLEKLLNKYKKKLKKLIKDNIGNEAVEDFENVTTKNPLGSEEMKTWILKIFEDEKWPVSEDDLQMLLKEIFVGHKYFIQAGDLIRVQKNTSDQSGEGALEIEAKDSFRNSAFTKLMQSAMRGVPILAPGENDGYYYEANIINWPDCENVDLQYNAFASVIQRPIEECVVMPVKEFIVKPGMKGLIKVLNVDNDRTFYLPGIVISPPKIDKKSGFEKFFVALYNGIESEVRKDEIVLVTKERYDAIVANIQQFDERASYTTSTSISSSIMSSEESTNEKGKFGKRSRANKLKQKQITSPSSYRKEQKSLIKKKKFNSKAKNKNAITTQFINPPFLEETKESQTIARHRPEINSAQTYSNVINFDEKFNKGLNISQTVKGISKEKKIVPEKQSKIRCFESTSAKTKKMNKNQKVIPSVQPGRPKSETTSRSQRTSYASEKVIIDNQREIKKIKGISKDSKNSLIHVDSNVELRTYERLKPSCVEHKGYSIPTNNYRVQPSEENDTLNVIGEPKNHKILQKVKPSPLPSGEKVIPVFIAEQNRGTTEQTLRPSVETSKKITQGCLTSTKPKLENLGTKPKQIPIYSTSSFEQQPVKLPLPAHKTPQESLTNQRKVTKKLSPTSQNIIAVPKPIKTSSKASLSKPIYSEKIVPTMSLVSDEENVDKGTGCCSKKATAEEERKSSKSKTSNQESKDKSCCCSKHTTVEEERKTSKSRESNVPTVSTLSEMDFINRDQDQATKKSVISQKTEKEQSVVETSSSVTQQSRTSKNVQEKVNDFKTPLVKPKSTLKPTSKKNGKNLDINIKPYTSLSNKESKEKEINVVDETGKNKPMDSNPPISKQKSTMKPSSKKNGKIIHTSNKPNTGLANKEKKEKEIKVVKETVKDEPFDMGNDKTSQTKNVQRYKEPYTKSKEKKPDTSTSKNITKESVIKSSVIKSKKDSAPKKEDSNKKAGSKPIHLVKENKTNEVKSKSKPIEEDVKTKTTSRSVSPYTARSNVTIMNDDNDQVYNIVLTPEPAILLPQPHPECKSFQISTITLAIREIAAISSTEPMLTTKSQDKKTENKKCHSKSSDGICNKCNLPKQPLSPEKSLKSRRTKSS